MTATITLANAKAIAKQAAAEAPTADLAAAWATIGDWVPSARADFADVLPTASRQQALAAATIATAERRGRSARRCFAAAADPSRPETY